MPVYFTISLYKINWPVYFTISLYKINWVVYFTISLYKINWPVYFKCLTTGFIGLFISRLFFCLFAVGILISPSVLFFRLQLESLFHRFTLLAFLGCLFHHLFYFSVCSWNPYFTVLLYLPSWVVYFTVCFIFPFAVGWYTGRERFVTRQTFQVRRAASE